MSLLQFNHIVVRGELLRRNDSDFYVEFAGPSIRIYRAGISGKWYGTVLDFDDPHYAGPCVSLEQVIARLESPSWWRRTRRFLRWLGV